MFHFSDKTHAGVPTITKTISQNLSQLPERNLELSWLERNYAKNGRLKHGMGWPAART
jgi:hypothetical protein